MSKFKVTYTVSPIVDPRFTSTTKTHTREMIESGSWENAMEVVTLIEDSDVPGLTYKVVKVEVLP